MVEISYATPEEREEVAAFMDRVFVRGKITMEGWRALVAGRWSGPGGKYAIIAREGGAIVGVLGLVYAQRMTAAGLRVTADMSSWYVLKEVRGQGVGQRILTLAMSDPGVTITNFSSALGAVNVLVNAGMAVLDRERLVWHPSDVAPFVVHEDPLALGDRLSEKDRRVIADHAGLRLRPVAVETPEGPVTLVIYPQKKHDDYVTHECMYLGDQALFARYAGRIAASVLPAREAILSLDRRLGAAGIEYDDCRAFTAPRFYVEGVMDPADIDLLYSECVLLNNKIH